MLRKDNLIAVHNYSSFFPIWCYTYVHLIHKSAVFVIPCIYPTITGTESYAIENGGL